jgi:hypothetical protein
MVMTFNPDDPHDGHAAADGGFTYRMVHIWPEYFTGLLSVSALPLFRDPVLNDPAAATALRRLFTTLTGPATALERQERMITAARLLTRHAAGRVAADGPITALAPPAPTSPPGRPGAYPMIMGSSDQYLVVFYP